MLRADFNRVINTLRRTDLPWKPKITRRMIGSKLTGICPLAAIADEFGIDWDAVDSGTSQSGRVRQWSFIDVKDWIDGHPRLRGLDTRTIQLYFDTGTTPPASLAAWLEKSIAVEDGVEIPDEVWATLYLEHA